MSAARIVNNGVPNIYYRNGMWRFVRPQAKHQFHQASCNCARALLHVLKLNGAPE